jgi:hypothetical protein
MTTHACRSPCELHKYTRTYLAYRYSILATTRRVEWLISLGCYNDKEKRCNFVFVEECESQSRANLKET